MPKRVILMDIDGTLLRKTIVLETLKRNPKLALKVLLKNPRLYLYGALYKLFGMDGLRAKFHETMKEIPKGEFDIKHFDPEYVRILRLAEEKGYPVKFVTTNPEHLLESFETVVRNAFPRLNYEIVTTRTVGEKLRLAQDLAEKHGYDYVHLFDDTLPPGGIFSPFEMRWDKERLLKEWRDRVASKKDPGVEMMERTLSETERRFVGEKRTRFVEHEK